MILNFTGGDPWSQALSVLKVSMKGFVWYLDAKGKTKYSLGICYIYVIKTWSAVILKLHFVKLIYSVLLGPGCSIPVPANQSFWTREEYSNLKLPRASHKAVVNGNIMWVVGGYMFNHSDYNMVLA